MGLNTNDFINLIVHERGFHGSRLLRGEEYNQYNTKMVDEWEEEAYQGQMRHKSWEKTSKEFKNYINDIYDNKKW